jgi:hypothetical protein
MVNPVGFGDFATTTSKEHKKMWRSKKKKQRELAMENKKVRSKS